MKKLTEFLHKHPTLTWFVMMTAFELAAVGSAAAIYFALGEAMRERLSDTVYLLGIMAAFILLSAVVLPIAMVLWARRQKKNQAGH
jgi:hypothetical protein